MKYAIRTPRLAAVIAWLLLTFLVLFPKGGFKIGEIPITWGYIVLALICIPLALIRLYAFPLRAAPLTLAAFASLLPFQIILAYSFWANGHEGIGAPAALVIVFVFMPALFLGVFPAFLRYVQYERFQRYFCFCILAAALWGIFLFFYHPIMGHYVEIPYLTVNSGDYGQLESTKHIDRGGYLKLISTYNNGNLYGVATLILFPLYLLLEPKLWKRNVVRIALVLTLSRSVWFGLIMEQVLSLVANLPSIVAHLPRIRPGRVLSQLLAVVATTCLVFSALLFNSAGLKFIFNSGLSGREDGFTAFYGPALIPVVPVGTFSELLYASALFNYGIAGFLAVMLIFAAPVLLMMWKPWIANTPTRRAAFKGLVVYAIVAGIDGATLLIPVMAFYFFAYMVMLHGMPGEFAAVPLDQTITGTGECPSPVFAID